MLTYAGRLSPSENTLSETERIKIPSSDLFSSSQESTVSADTTRLSVFFSQHGSMRAPLPALWLHRRLSFSMRSRRSSWQSISQSAEAFGHTRMEQVYEVTPWKCEEAMMHNDVLKYQVSDLAKRCARQTSSRWIEKVTRQEPSEFILLRKIAL